MSTTNETPQETTQTHLQNFWNILTLKVLPKSCEDIRALVQVEMMKHYTRGPICKINPSHVEKYMLKIFVKDTTYFCVKSKFLVNHPSIRKLIDMILSEHMYWHIETNLEGHSYLFASWQHWNM
jgi:hypothetical protein